MFLEEDSIIEGGQKRGDGSFTAILPAPVFQKVDRGVARGRSWGARDLPLVGLLLSKQPTIFRWQKLHDNILAVKAIVEKPTFLKFVFCKVFLSTALVFS